MQATQKIDLIDPVAIQPRHHQVAQRIRAFVRKSGLQAGQKMPSERVMSRQLGVSHGMVRLANDILIRQGIVQREHGRGTFIKATSKTTAKGNALVTGPVGYLAVTDEGLQGYTLKQYQQMETLARQERFRFVFGSVLPHATSPIPMSFVQDQVAGIVVDGDIDENYLSRLSDLGLPVVVAGNHPIVPGLTYCRMNATSLFRQFTEKLIEQGHHAIWFGLGTMKLFYAREMFDGYRQALDQANIGPELMVFNHSGQNLLEQVVRQFLRSYAQFGPKQAILYSGRARPLAQRLEQAGVDTSQLDIITASTASDGLSWATAWNWPVDQIGKLAPQMLFDELAGKNVRSHTYEPQLETHTVDGHLKLSVTWHDVERNDAENNLK